jgi:hypothetical protein
MVEDDDEEEEEAGPEAGKFELLYAGSRSACEDGTSSACF